MHHIDCCSFVHLSHLVPMLSPVEGRGGCLPNSPWPVFSPAFEVHAAGTRSSWHPAGMQPVAALVQQLYGWRTGWITRWSPSCHSHWLLAQRLGWKPCAATLDLDPLRGPRGTPLAWPWLDLRGLWLRWKILLHMAPVHFSGLLLSMPASMVSEQSCRRHC